MLAKMFFPVCVCYCHGSFVIEAVSEFKSWGVECSASHVLLRATTDAKYRSITSRTLRNTNIYV